MQKVRSHHGNNSVRYVGEYLVPADCGKACPGLVWGFALSGYRGAAFHLFLLMEHYRRLLLFIASIFLKVEKEEKPHFPSPPILSEKLQNTSIPIRGPAAADHETPSSLKSLYFKGLWKLPQIDFPVSLLSVISVVSPLQCCVFWEQESKSIWKLEVLFCRLGTKN